jgi:hypothetical protein
MIIALGSVGYLCDLHSVDAGDSPARARAPRTCDAIEGINRQICRGHNAYKIEAATERHAARMYWQRLIGGGR